MLDEIDLKILRAIQLDARISNVALAEQVGLSATPCWYRVKALEEKGVIERYVTIFDHVALGYPDTAIVEVKLDRHDDAAFEQFEAAITNVPEVIEAYLATGEYDYFVKAAVSSIAEYERFLRQRLYTIPGIRHSRSSFVLRRLKQTYSVKAEAITLASVARGEKPRLAHDMKDKTSRTPFADPSAEPAAFPRP